jgi:tetratricopeptide (TPR) repeat protein
MSQIVLPKNVHEFVRTESGSHLLLLLLEHSFGHALQRIDPVERANMAHEYGNDSTVELDLELLLDHLSMIRVIANLNSHAEESLINYWSAEDGAIFLADARRYVADALRIAPQKHPERGRAYKNLAYVLLAQNKTKAACELVCKAMEIFQQNGLMEHIEELLEMISTRTEEECKLVQENIAAVLPKKELESL